MKKALIISYHFLPMDVIASYRAKAYADHLSAQGIFPTIITHRWEDNKNENDRGTEWDFHTDSKIKIEHFQTHSVIRLPRVKTKEKLLPPFLNRARTFYYLVIGKFEQNLFASHASFKDFLFSHLQVTKYDLIIGIFSPHFHLELSYELHKKFKIPYILDFRDLWDNRIIHQNYRPSLKEKIEDLLTQYYWKKWLSKASFFTITSEPWKQKLESFSKTKGFVITNGHEKEFLNNISDIKQKKFIITHVGSLYHHQKLDIFLNGVRLFIERHDIRDILIQFIGAIRVVNKSSSFNGYMDNVEDYLGKYLPPWCLEVTKRQPKNVAINYLADANLLLFPSFPEAPGTYAGKIFDYIAVKKNILVAPGDNSVVDDLIRETNAGFIANTSEEVFQIITRKFHEWKQNGFIRYAGNISKIEHYSREAQVQKMAKLIHHNL